MTRTLSAALISALLAAAPAAALAQSACESKKAQSCATGFVWDSETKACVQVSS